MPAGLCYKIAFAGDTISLTFIGMPPHPAR
jgi:hypothetical protein